MFCHHTKEMYFSFGKYTHSHFERVRLQTFILVTYTERFCVEEDSEGRFLPSLKQLLRTESSTVCSNFSGWGDTGLLFPSVQPEVVFINILSIVRET